LRLLAYPAAQMRSCAAARPLNTLDLRIDGERVNLPVADDVRLKRESKANGGRIQVEVVLSWSA
jgi:hypothetical protein